MKKILTSIFLILLVLTLTSCIRSKTEYYEDDYFHYLDKDPSRPDYGILICGISPLAAKQKYLVFPTSFNGKETVIANGNNWGGQRVHFEFISTKKVFLPFGVGGASNFYSNLHSSRLKLICMNDENMIKPSYNNSYVTYRYHCKQIEEFGYYIMPANVSYWYNYEDAPHYGYYWIDDYDNELIDFIPEDPTREGYTFKGWYKEPECINKWDFEVDLVPEKEYKRVDLSKEYVYKETKLYAKWELN